MPNLSTNMGFNLFLESDVVDFEQLNATFEKLDKMVLCIESGQKRQVIQVIQPVMLHGIIRNILMVLLICILLSVLIT